MAEHDDSTPATFTIGYALCPKKRQSFLQPSLVFALESRGIRLAPIDPDLPIPSQGHFHLILHKLTDHPSFPDHLRAFLSSHPSVPVVDHPDIIGRLHNRCSMLQAVSDLWNPTKDHTLGIPNQVFLHEPPKDLAFASSLNFPVIAKPLVADGSEKSHKMSLIFHPEGLLKLNPPVVLQEFVNHGGVIFKVYVAGDHVRCVKRKSLPDVSEEEKEGCVERSVSFSQVSNTPVTGDAATEMKHHETALLEKAEMPPENFIKEIAKGLRREMGLRLFNFDVIRDVKAGNRYLVIDINYFPGYAKMPDYVTVMVDFFWDVLHENEMKKTGEEQNGSEFGGVQLGLLAS